MKNKFWILIIGIYLGFGIWNSGFGYNIYWANLHSHTELSDGRGTPQEAYLYARDTAQIDVLALTDHTHYLNQENYQYTRAIADSFTEDGRFVAIAGQEFGSLSAFGHFSMFEAESLCRASVYDLNSTYQWIGRNKVQSQYNHPRLGDFEDFTYNREGDKYVSAIEIVNGSGLYTPYYEERYVDALNQGWHIAPVANQDNHYRRWGNATTTQGQIPLTAICADTLTKDAILEAISKGRIYACEIKPATDKILLKDFSIGNKTMGDVYYTMDKQVSIKFQVEAQTNFSRIILYRNGIVFIDSTTNTNNIDWTLNDTMTNGYYFIKGIQQDGDEFWSAPIWVNYQYEANGIEAWPNPIKTSSQIRFPNCASVSSSDMSIYTMEGKLIFSQHKNNNEIQTWNGTDNDGNILDNEIFFVVIKAQTTNGIKIYKGKVALLRNQ